MGLQTATAGERAGTVVEGHGLIGVAAVEQEVEEIPALREAQALYSSVLSVPWFAARRLRGAMTARMGIRSASVELGKKRTFIKLICST